MNKPFKRYSSFRADGLEPFREFVETKLSARILDLPDQDQKIDLNARLVPFPNSKLWFCSYGAPIKIGFPDDDYYRLQVHRNGVGASIFKTREVLISPKQACVSAARAEIFFGAGYEQFAMRIDKSFLVQKLSTLLDRHFVSPIVFHEAFDLTNPKSSHWLQTFNFVVQMMEEAPRLSSFVYAEMEQLLLISTLCASRHNYSDYLNTAPAKAAPWQVRRAEEYIEANWDKPLCVEQLAKMTGASVRSIFRTFRQSRGYSPLAFLKQVRLRRAHEMICAGNEVTISDIAYATGFSNLGHFSKDFRKAYGILPSAALRLNKRTQGQAN